MTDVFELRLQTRADLATLRSALYGLLEGAGSLGIKRDEIDGTLNPYAAGYNPALIIYDVVAGGAGHAQRIGSSITDVVRAALVRLRGCQCGEETSCYGCLRSYSNQFWHDELSRGAAISVLAPLVE